MKTKSNLLHHLNWFGFTFVYRMHINAFLVSRWWDSNKLAQQEFTYYYVLFLMKCRFMSMKVYETSNIKMHLQTMRAHVKTTSQCPLQLLISVYMIKFSSLSVEGISPCFISLKKLLSTSKQKHLKKRINITACLFCIYKVKEMCFYVQHIKCVNCMVYYSVNAKRSLTHTW